MKIPKLFLGIALASSPACSPQLPDHKDYDLLSEEEKERFIFKAEDDAEKTEIFKEILDHLNIPWDLFENDIEEGNPLKIAMQIQAYTHTYLNFIENDRVLLTDLDEEGAHGKAYGSLTEDPDDDYIVWNKNDLGLWVHGSAVHEVGHYVTGGHDRPISKAIDGDVREEVLDVMDSHRDGPYLASYLIDEIQSLHFYTFVESDSLYNFAIKLIEMKSYTPTEAYRYLLDERANASEKIRVSMLNSFEENPDSFPALIHYGMTDKKLEAYLDENIDKLTEVQQWYIDGAIAHFLKDYPIEK